MIEQDGTCLCGEITWQFSGKPEAAFHCHCSMCRKAHGAAFASYYVVTAEAFQWTSNLHSLGSFQSSGAFARAFCTTCGAIVPNADREQSRFYVPAGSHAHGPAVEAHIFVGSKAPWYEITDQLPQYDAFPPGDDSNVCPDPVRPPPTAGVVRGSCLCQAVAFELREPFKAIHNCHCSRCRKARAAAFTSNGFTSMDGVEFIRGKEHVKTFKLPAGRFFSQAFCTLCGSGLPRLDSVRNIAVTPLGALDDEPGTRPGGIFSSLIKRTGLRSPTICHSSRKDRTDSRCYGIFRPIAGIGRRLLPCAANFTEPQTLSTNLDLANDRASRLYEYLVDEEDARVCKDIADEACRYVPVNFVLLILANTLSKLGDELSNPKTALAWLLSFLHAPVYLVGLLVPIRESGSMLPQLFIASFVRRLAVRKWVWVAGSLAQCAAITGMGAVALSLTGAAAGWAIIGLLVVFSLARGLCSVAHKDVLGKTIPKTRRGRLAGISAGIAGLLTLAVGMVLLFQTRATSSPLFYAALLAAAGSLWLLAAAVFAQIREERGASDGGANAFTEALNSLQLLRTDGPFRQFVIVRALLMCSALTAPYYVVLATGGAGAGLSTLGAFIIANGLASSLSAPIWGKLADASSKTVLIRSALITALLGVLTFMIVMFTPRLAAQPWLFPLAYFVLGIAHSGVRLGRKTYVVDMASGNKRTDYVAVSNTVIGVLLLLTGLIGALASVISPVGVILVLSLFGLAGAALATRLAEVQ